MSTLVAVIVVLALWALLFVLAIAEASLIGMTRSRANALAEEEVPGADQLVLALEDRGFFLGPIFALTLAAPVSYTHLTLPTKRIV